MTLPPLQPADAALLTRYLLAHEDLHTLLAQPSAPELLPLLSFLANPDITPWLDHYRAIMAHAHQHAALNALSEVLRETTDPTQRRLAATALLSNRTPRPPRPPHAQHPPHTPRPEAHGSDPWAPAPTPRATPRAPRQHPHSSLDASIPGTTRPCRLDAFPELDHPLNPVKPAPPRAAPTTLDQAIATLSHFFTTPAPRHDINRELDDVPANDLDARLDTQFETKINAQVAAAFESKLDSALADLDDIPHTSDPLLAAALTSVQSPFNDFDLVPTASHPTRAHARDAPSG